MHLIAPSAYWISKHGSYPSRSFWKAAAIALSFGLGSVGLAESGVARVWNEQNLTAIRLDRPHPPVQARNLFAVSAAMYDAWAAYDTVAAGYIYKHKHTAANLAAARDEAVSYAAYRILKERYALSLGAAKTLAVLDHQLVALGYNPANKSLDPSTPAGLGNAVAAAVSAWFMGDGARQQEGYTDVARDLGGYVCVNQPMVTGLSGTNVTDVNRWQPLAIANALDQNGNPTGPVQSFQGPQWLRVRTFQLAMDDPTRPRIDPGPPPSLGGPQDAQFRAEVVEIIRRSSELTADDGVVLDYSPGVFGNNRLGLNDGTGHPLNPATNAPYASNLIRRGDFARVLSEFWADGPKSETPPGHWNVFANEVSDHPLFVKRVGGTGPVLDALEWEVKLYFALNGAVHDAACAAWSIKRYYDGFRPITAIRYLGQLGQSTTPRAPSYHANGLPLIPGLIELVTPGTSRPHQRHAGLPAGAIALLTWSGQPADPVNQEGGLKWILAADWLPYMNRSFVTPGFPGYVSGHSTFSRAAAELLTEITGSAFFPGGMATHQVEPATALKVERGPSQQVQLQWATYFDAADQAGLSRLWTGIHVSADDLAGRRAGAQCGQEAWALALTYFNGSVALNRSGHLTANHR